MKPMELDFKTEDELLQYVIDSDTNGQRDQVRRLWNGLSKKQQHHFVGYCRNTSQDAQGLKILEYVLED